jgi:uncharacterized protein YcfL
MRRGVALITVLLLAALLVSCRNEAQNQIRRSIQDFTGQRMYITLYSRDGTPIFEGIVDGKVTRSSATLSGSNEAAAGSYIYWYDERGRYHQTDLPYLLTNYDRSGR